MRRLPYASRASDLFLRDMRIFPPRGLTRCERLAEGFIQTGNELGNFDDKRHEDQLQFMSSGASAFFVAASLAGDRVRDMTPQR